MLLIVQSVRLENVDIPHGELMEKVNAHLECAIARLDLNGHLHHARVAHRQHDGRDYLTHF